MTTHENDENQFSDISEETMSEVDKFYSSFCSEHGEEMTAESLADNDCNEDKTTDSLVDNDCTEEKKTEGHDEEYDDIDVSDEEIERVKRVAPQHQGCNRKRARIEESGAFDREEKLSSVQVRESESSGASKQDTLTFALFDLETDGLVKLGSHEIPDILQIGVKKFVWTPELTTKEEYNSYITPRKPIPSAATRVNKLHRINGKLVKIIAGRWTQLDTISIKDGLVGMWEWLLQDGPNVVMVGFNNQNFDNHVLAHHTRVRCDSQLLERVKCGVQFSDVRTILNMRGIYGTLETNYYMSNGPDLTLHDAITDCDALCHVIKSRGITRDRLMVETVTMETVLGQTNVFVIENLMTAKTADKVSSSISLSDYLSLSEDELFELLKSLKVHISAIRSCIKKRSGYRG